MFNEFKMFKMQNILSPPEGTCSQPYCIPQKRKKEITL